MRRRDFMKALMGTACIALFKPRAVQANPQPKAIRENPFLAQRSILVDPAYGDKTRFYHWQKHMPLVLTTNRDMKHSIYLLVGMMVSKDIHYACINTTGIGMAMFDAVRELRRTDPKVKASLEGREIEGISQGYFNDAVEYHNLDRMKYFGITRDQL